MSLQHTISSQYDIDCLKKAVLESACSIDLAINGIDDLSILKFTQSMKDPLTGKNTNFIEYLNMLFTYLVCISAASLLLNRFPDKSFRINFGTTGGYDVESTDGEVICECFV